MDDALWEVEEVSEYTGIPVSSIYKMTSRKARVPIPHVRIGGRLRFRKHLIDRWIEVLTISNLEPLARAKKAAGGL